MTTAALKQKRAAKLDALKAIQTRAATENRDLNEAETSEWRAGEAEVRTLDTQLGRAEFLAEAERRAVGQPVSDTGDGFDAELRKFSLRAAIASQIPDIAHQVDAGREREISTELARRAGKPSQGIMVPMAVFEKRVLTTAAPGGGPGSNLIATDHLGNQFIDILRAKLITQARGATVLSGLVGNVDIPRLKASATAYWVAENNAITPSDPQFDKVQMTPKHCGAITEFSRNMLLQSSPDIEGLMRNDFAKVLAEGIDRVAIDGGGSNEPDGILNSSPTSATMDGPTWAQVLGMIAALQLDNADMGALGWATSPNVVKKLRSTLKDAAFTSGDYLMDGPDALAGYALSSSNVVPQSGSSPSDRGTLIFGNWSDLLIGYWSAFDILVNPYESTAYAKGNVQVRGMLTCDVAVRHAESFVAATDVDIA